jgi:hypothetical protein
MDTKTTQEPENMPGPGSPCSAWLGRGPDEMVRPFDALYALRDYAFHTVDCPDNGYAAGGGAGACVCGLDEAWRAAVALIPTTPACSDQ